MSRRAPCETVTRGSDQALTYGRENVMAAWVWVLIGIAYITLFFWLGLATLRNGHGWLFFFGIFFPILWIFGALAQPRETVA